MAVLGGVKLGLFKTKKMDSHGILDKFLENYKPGECLAKPDDELLRFGQNVLPEEIIALWTNYGFGEYGDGILKVVDPREYMGSLYSWLGKEDFSKIPIIVTAFGDIFYFRNLGDGETDFSILDVHYRKIEVCTYSWEAFFKDYIVDKTVMRNILREKLYEECIENLGRLNYKEIFFFAPALVIGGAEDIKYVKKGKAEVHHQVLLQIGR